jgi:predicted metalloprotease with PDZ domain
MMLRPRYVARFFALALLLAVSATAATGQTAPVDYTVRLDPLPASHLLHVRMRVRGVAGPSVDVAMPAWSPGAYRITDAWREVQEFSATETGGAPLKFEKVDKQTWRVFRGEGCDIVVNYDLYWRDYNDEVCYLRGPQVFMYVVGRPPYPMGGPVNLKVEAPANWRAQTGMDSGPEPNTFRAPDYDTFVDASVVLGPDLEQTEFDYKGIPHYLVFIGKGNYDERRITDDTRKVVSTLIDMMNGAPYKKYVFFLRARQGPGAGGLEHLNSTDITFSAYDTHATRAAYNRFLFVVAHEFFHLWNVKRIRPHILGPFDYTREQNTRDLYVSEGMTSYWATVGLERGGLWTRQDFFDDLAEQIKTLQSSPGRKMMSAELSSWNTWARSDNASNSSIDYYNKGQLIGDLLELEIRYRTQNRRTLLDVFHYLFEHYALPKPGFDDRRGFRDAVEAVVREVEPSRADFGDFFARYVSGTEEIPWDEYLAHAGLALEEKRGQPQPSIGITTGTSVPSNFPGAPPTPLPEGQLAITNVRPGSPAMAAGLDVGDILVALNGVQVTPQTFNQRWAEQKPGATVTFTVMRRGQLRVIPVQVGEETPVTYAIKERAEAGELEKKILAGWLTGQ